MWQTLKQRFFKWITHERPNTDLPLCDFERIRYEVRPCDVILVEGRSRVSEVIRQITQSPWTHACLYIGRIHDVDNPALREQLSEHFAGDPDVQLVIEGYLGKGTIVTPLEYYKSDHLRICRPRGLSRRDSQQVIEFAIHKLGSDYDVRQVIDLARFLIPWSIMPRRWRSSLFQYHPGESTKTVCSTMIAEAFSAIDFPILPLVKQHEETGIELFIRNPRIFTPRDFDYSPYFDIIKYPFVSFAEGPYRSLPWNREGLISHDGENIYNPRKEKEKEKEKAKESASAPLTKEKILTKTKIKLRFKTKNKEPLAEKNVTQKEQKEEHSKEKSNNDEDQPSLETFSHTIASQTPSVSSSAATTEELENNKKDILNFISHRFI